MATMPLGCSLQVVSPRWRSHADEYPLLPPLPGELGGGWAPPGGGPVQPAGRAGRAQAGRIACTPSGQRAFPASAHTWVVTTAWRVTVVEESDAVGVLVRRVERVPLVPSWKHSQAERDGSCLGPVTRPSPGDRRSGQSASRCSRRSGPPTKMS
jgi:hypothetical protein